MADLKDKDFIKFISKIYTCWRGFIDLVDFIGEIVKPKTIVELGVANGYSTLLLAKITDKNGDVFAVDKWEGREEECRQKAEDNIAYAKEHFGINNIHLIHKEFTSYFYESFWKKQIDILHIDGDHSDKCVREDFDMWSPFVSPNGLILLHDVTNASFTGPLRACREEQDNWNVLIYPQELGLGIITKNHDIYSKLKDKFEILKDIKEWQT